MKKIDAFQSHAITSLDMSSIAGGCSREQNTKNGATTIKVTCCDVDDCPAKKDPSLLLPSGQNARKTVEAPSSKKLKSKKG